MAGELVELEGRVREYLSKHDASHDFSHIQRVVRNARQILEEERVANPSIDENLVVVTALVHDVGDFKYCKDANVQRGHLRTILDGLVDESVQRRVVEIVANMSFRKELEQREAPIQESLEFKIVQDADRLDAIGAIGLARCFVYSGATGQPILSADAMRDSIDLFDFFKDSKLTAERYNQAAIRNDGNAVGHIFEKLLTLKDRMKTTGGKRIAEERHAFMLSFLQQLGSELK